MILIITVPCVFLLTWFAVWWYNFSNQFRRQGLSAKKLNQKEIENWKKRGLSGSEAGQSFNNGWINPTQIVNGKIKLYTNYQQSDKNLNPAKVNRTQLDNCYRILHNISEDDNPRMNYDYQINQLKDYFLPYGRKKWDLLSIQNERKWDLIYQNIKKSETIKEVNQETENIKYLDDYYSDYKKTKAELIKVQNDQLNSFLNEEQRKVFDLAIQGKSIFYTGSAGTGKSFLLKRIIRSLELLGREIAVTAPTGIAAVNVGGTTIHSFSGIGTFGDVSPPEDLVKKIFNQKSQKWVSNWNTISTLIIDEISMLSGVIFDKLEYISRKVRRKHRPFGGLQLILTGDFFQLPPVKSKIFCFEAKKWNHVLSHTINLNKIYRQQEPKLINLLNEIRFGEISDESREILRNLEQEPNFPNDGIKATQLVSNNDEKNAINNTELNKVDGKMYNFRANDWEDERYKGRLEILIKNCLAVDNLELKKGCQVMLIKNLRNSAEELILVNGSQGIVVGFDKENYPIVRFANGMERVITEEEWTDETPLYKLKRARRKQIPLVLSWAITIHKSQGQSIERLKVDLSRVFERGQTYVALSRACSLKYLQVIGFSEKKIICDEKVKKFYRKLLTV
ncbi:MAG: AAA family ATPase [Candidatus Moeniiplasma glomeromycotorum]|nr:AAA family ATPase [Candidatus Moeniiplasma glomeromycotorum]MCE8167887.1 AAA family ATPase [Candidatus Moeniiplasma glomeromycotorum]MCE8169437.1 AAA family ATPase [Candidatus Moeniiplasma glomeromycotorum]